MEAPPTPPLEVAEANFLLEFSVILFDPPAAFGGGDDVVEGRMARQGDQPIANRIRGSDRPLEQQRLFALGPVATDAHPDRGEASAQLRPAAFAPRRHAERGTRAASARTDSAASWPRHRRARRLSSGGRTGVVARTAAA